MPPELIDFAGIDETVTFVGRGARFQIWEPGAYQKNRAMAFERARVRGATLKLRPTESDSKDGDA